MHVLDASDPAFRQQFEVTRTVLAELHADDAPSLVLLNKIDKVSEEERAALREEFPEALQVSARSTEDKALVHAALVHFFEKDMLEETFTIPYAKQALTSRLHQEARVLSETYDDEGAVVKVRASRVILERFKKDLSRT